MNKVVLVGRLVADPELTFVGEDSAVTKFTLAVSKYNSKTQEKEADFIRCKVWGKQAENLAEYKQKGDQISIRSRIETGSYEDQDGKKKYTTEVVCNEVEYLGSKPQEDFSNDGRGNGANKNAVNRTQNNRNQKNNRSNSK